MRTDSHAGLRIVEPTPSDLLAVEERTNGAAVSGVALGNIFYDVSAALRQFQIVQHRDLSVTIRVVPVEQLPADALAQIGKSAERLLAGVRVNVETVEDLPRSAAGKHHLVIVER